MVEGPVTSGPAAVVLSVETTPAQASPASSAVSSDSSAPTPLRLVNYQFESPNLGVIAALVRIPPHVPGAKLPVLVLLHGRGEAQKSPERGARGFIEDYGLEAAWTWLDSKPGARLAPPEVPASYRRSIEAELDRTPFEGMVVVMPYLPDRFRGPEVFVNAPQYARVLRDIVSRVKSQLPVKHQREAWALDGISLGGRVAMACVAELAADFGAFGSVQAAIDERELASFADLLSEARRHNPSVRFSLATSDQDYFRVVLEHYHAALTARSLTHEWTTLPGDHSYAFNRGPGVTYLLFTHDRHLR